MKARLPLSSDYLETRRPASEQGCINMYPHTKGGYRQYPGLVEVGNVYGEIDVTSLKTENISANTTNSSGVWVKPDGLAVYVLDASTPGIDQYSLSTANDLDSTVAYVNTVALTGTGTVTEPKLLGISSDGTKTIWTASDGSSNLYVYLWTMSTPWDITTATSTSSFAFTADTGTYLMGFLNSDGTKAYLCVGKGTGDQTLTAYTMSTGYDVTGLTVTSDTLTLEAMGYPGADYREQDLCTNSDVSVIYQARSPSNPVNNNIKIRRYELSTAGTLATASNAGTFKSGETEFESRAASGVALFDSGGQMLFTSYYLSDYLLSVDLSTVGETGRGAINMADVLYAVMGTSLYSVDSDGLTLRLGTIAGTSQERVVMETDGTQLVITTGTDGGTIYRFTGSTLTTVTDSDITDTANSSAYLDLRFWLDQPNGQFRSSNVDDATAYDALDVATAESFADDIQRAYAHNERLYFFGETSTEIWRTGTGRPPASREVVIERGIVGSHAISSIDDQIYFVDQYRRPNVMSGFQYQPIYQAPAMAEEWDTYTTDSDCVVLTYTYRQQNFVEFIFPTDDKSWTLHVASGKWNERQNSSGNRVDAIEYVNVYDSVWAIDKSNSKAYQFSETTYQDDGSNITRTLYTGTVGPELIGADTRKVSVDGLWLTIESTGSGSVSVSFARDGGSFETAKTLTVSDGVKNYPLATPWGDCSEGVFKITTTANAGIDFVDALVDLSPRNV